MEKIDQDNIQEIRTLINNKFAQKDEDAHRFIKETENSHLGEYFEIRNGFSRDVDRILYSKSFRRLQHKAQVYSNKKGDHYRTRLTHTLEVSQISKGISRNLNLNIDLTEAIALGHDIGHTPFGHAGERILDGIMRGNDDLGGKLKYNIDYGGFKHNFNSLKIVEIVEKKNDGIGLNLNWQTLDGILKHTSIVKNETMWDFKRFVKDASNYKSFIDYDYYKSEKPEYEIPLTLEGQVVFISDEIAQREHDLDDSLRDDGLGLSIKELAAEIENILKRIDKNFDKNASGHELFNKLREKINELKPINSELKWNKLTSIVISYFIRDVTETTMLNILSEKEQNIIRYDNLEKPFDTTRGYNKKFIIKKLVTFSKFADSLNKEIENFIEKNTIDSYNVNRFDGKSKYILRQLFKAYYENPKQMTKKQINILKYNVLNIVADQMTIDLGNYKIKDFDVLSEKMLNLLKLENNELDSLLSRCTKIFDLKSNDEMLNYVNAHSYEEIYLNSEYDSDLMKSVKYCLELHYCYLSIICDYISQMTDDYAMKEYEELYLI